MGLLVFTPLLTILVKKNNRNLENWFLTYISLNVENYQ